MLQHQEFRDIIWYEWLYKIARNWDVFSTRSWKVIWTHIHRDYIRVSLFDWDDIRKHHRVHRLVAYAFIENHENKTLVNHKDWNKQNNNDWNLEWCTMSENMKHAYRELWFNGNRWYRYQR